MNDIKAVNIRVGYGENDIVKGLSITLPANKTTSIIGPNGCGKSTLLKALASIIPSRGEVFIGGKNITAYSRKKLAQVLAMLPQKPEATNGLTVEELVR
ncbi:ABC transporter ATP-binding protein, partial [Aduncisulcus paluster]